jgi:DNA replication licensing factor MCM5
MEGQDKNCPMDPYLIIHPKSTFTDHQTLKLQEAPDMVPVGELPRHMLLSAERYLTGRVVPGSRVIATGIYSTFQSSKNVGVIPALKLSSDQIIEIYSGVAHSIPQDRQS